MAKHAVLSPSSAKRWMTCPGSVALSEGIVEPPSKFADEGTAAHFLASYCLEQETNAEEHIGRTVYLLKNFVTGEHFESFNTVKADVYLNDFQVDEDMARHVQVYLDYVRDVLQSTNGELFVEVSVPLTHITGEEDASGTSDAIIIADNEIIVIDLKYGRGVEVQAEGNPQMLMYASGAREHFKEAIEGVERVRVAISQPRVSALPSEWDCGIEALREFEAEVRHAAEDVSAVAKDVISGGLSPSEEGCRWCKAKATCPALAEKVQREVGADFDIMPALPDPAKSVQHVTNDELSQKMSCLDLIEDWCKAVRAKVESELLSGHEVLGFKLVQGRKGSRAWTSKDEAEAAMKAMRLKKEEMYDFSIISPTTAEKVLKEQPKRWAKLQELIGQSEGKPSVAPVSDKRPALEMAPVADDFNVVN